MKINLIIGKPMTRTLPTPKKAPAHGIHASTSPKLQHYIEHFPVEFMCLDVLSVSGSLRMW